MHGASRGEDLERKLGYAAALFRSNEARRIGLAPRVRDRWEP